ncbi:MAG: tetratricopeptide repeat protein [Planctomycetota bacterium]
MTLRADEDVERPDWHKYLVPLVLLAAVLLAYAPVWRAGFVWDDPEYVVNNPTLRDLDGLARIWFSLSTPQYYPLVFTTFWAEFQLWGLYPLGYHLTNVLLHAAGTILLWKLLRRLRAPAALGAAALFALHPVHAESVAWITERKNVLSLVFYLAAAHAYLRWAVPAPEVGAPGRRRARGLSPYLVALALFVAALLSKTVTCTLPLALILVIWWKKGRLAWRDLAPLLPFFVVGAALGVTTATLEKTHVGAQGDEWSLGLLERALLAGTVPWFYVSKLVWPFGLTFVYPHWTIDAADPQWYLSPLATVGVVSVLFLVRARIGRGPLTAALFFLASLFPALGFFNVYPMRFSFVADHFQYLASIGPLTLLVALLSTAAGRLSARAIPLGRGAAIAALLVLVGLTWKQASIYRDIETLWRDTLAKNPSAWIAHSNLGEVLVAQGRIDEALLHCETALRLNRDLPEAHGNLANALYLKGRFEEALAHQHEVARLDPENVKILSNMGATLEAMGRLEEARASFEEALRRAPDYATAHFNLGNVLVKQGAIDRAAEHYESAARLAPDFLLAHYKLGLLREAQGERDEAARCFRCALHLARFSGDAGLAREIARCLDRCR